MSWCLTYIASGSPVTVDIEAQKNGPGIFRARAGIQYIQKYQTLIKNTIKKILFNNINKGSNLAIDIQRSLFYHRLDIEEDLEKLKQELDMSGTSSASDALKLQGVPEKTSF